MARKNQSGGRRGDLFNAVEGKPFRVGYGRPPTETRFKPGISGNPKGRNRQKERRKDFFERTASNN